MTQQTEGSEQMEQSLIDIAVESWRFSRLFGKVVSKLDAGESGRYANQLQAHQQVVFDREAGKNLAALRHIADARCSAFVGFGMARVFAVQRDDAAIDRHQTHEGFQQRGFAHAIAAQQHRDLAQFRIQAHIAKDVRAAVILMDVFDFKHWKPS